MGVNIIKTINCGWISIAVSKNQSLEKKIALTFICMRNAIRSKKKHFSLEVFSGKLFQESFSEQFFFWKFLRKVFLNVFLESFFESFSEKIFQTVFLETFFKKVFFEKVIWKVFRELFPEVFFWKFPLKFYDQNFLFSKICFGKLSRQAVVESFSKKFFLESLSKPFFKKKLEDTARYALCGLWPRLFFCPSGKKRAYYTVLAQFWKFLVPSSNLGNF